MSVQIDERRYDVFGFYSHDASCPLDLNAHLCNLTEPNTQDVQIAELLAIDYPRNCIAQRTINEEARADAVEPELVQPAQPTGRPLL